VGTQFIVYDSGPNPLKTPETETPREELAAIIYDQNILGYNGPRKMTIHLPAMSPDQTRIPITPRSPEQGIINRQTDREVLCLFNKSPQWNEENQSFVLNFNGRVSLASVKNFQIVHEND